MSEEKLVHYKPFDRYFEQKIDQLRQATDKRISALEAANEVYKSENEVYKSENEALLELVQKMFHGEVIKEEELKRYNIILQEE